MSFVKCPSAIKIPAIPNMTPSDLWSGAPGDAGLIAFASGASAIGSRLITTGDICYRFSVSGWFDFVPAYGVCNGYVYWYSENGYWLYRASGMWIIHSRFPGYAPSATYDDDAAQWRGDGWYESSSLPFGDGASAVFALKGTHLNNYTEGKTVSFKFPRWAGASIYGVYAAAGDQTGAATRTMGLPRWIDGNGTYYLRSLEKTDEKYVYGDIHYDATAGQWVIGTIGDASGWYVGGEPVTSGNVNFVHTLPEGSEEEPGPDLVITFVDYVRGDEKQTAWMGEAAIWRA